MRIVLPIVILVMLLTLVSNFCSTGHRVTATDEELAEPNPLLIAVMESHESYDADLAAEIVAELDAACIDTPGALSHDIAP